MQLAKHLVPLVFGAKVMQRGGGEDDVEGCLAELNFAHVGLDRAKWPAADGANALLGLVEHREAEIDERHVEVRQALEYFECVVACAATDVQEPFCLRVC